MINSVLIRQKFALAFLLRLQLGKLSARVIHITRLHKIPLAQCAAD